jgi:hypothetical protein
MDENGDIVQDEAEASGEVSSIIKIYLDEFLNSKAIGTIDMAYNGADTLYVVSDEYDGLMEVDLSSGTLNGVTGVTYAKKTGDFGGLGVALDENELIYINTGNRILTFDGNDWVDLGIDLREDGGHDYNGYYTDLVITDIDYTSSDAESSSSQHLYVASGLSPEEEVDDEVPHHVIIYSNEGGDWTYYKTVNFDF